MIFVVVGKFGKIEEVVLSVFWEVSFYGGVIGVYYGGDEDFVFEEELVVDD